MGNNYIEIWKFRLVMPFMLKIAVYSGDTPCGQNTEIYGFRSGVSNITTFYATLNPHFLCHKSPKTIKYLSAFSSI